MLWRAQRWARYRGRRFECPVCGTGLRRWRVDAYSRRCPMCACQARDRMLWLWLARDTDFFSAPRTVLHVAPEEALQARFREAANLRYVSADLVSPLAEVRCDVRLLPFGDAVADVVFCNHVLQYILDDRAAMRELLRVLRPGGFATVLVPYRAGGPTDEDFGDLTHEERLARFGPDDPWRRYGEDLAERMAESGLDLRAEVYSDRLGDDAEHFGLQQGEMLLVASSRQGATPRAAAADPPAGRRSSGIG